MFFKRSSGRTALAVPLFLSLLILVAAGCDGYLRSQADRKSEEVELKTEAIRCLRPVPDRVVRWLRDESTKEEVISSFDCMRLTVDHFALMARGENNSRDLTAEELRSYINEALPRDRQIPPELMRQLMDLKVAFLGGTSKVMTRFELIEIKGLLNFFERYVTSFNGRMKVVTYQAHDANLTLQEIKAIEADVRSLLLGLLERTQLSQSAYELRSLSQLFIEFERYLKSPPLMVQLVGWFPFTHGVMDLFVGRVRDFHTAKSWQEHFDWISKAYGASLTYFYFLRDKEKTPSSIGPWLSTRESVNFVSAWIDRVFELAETSRVIREGRVLDMEDINRVVADFIAAGGVRTEMTTFFKEETLPLTICRLVANFATEISGLKDVTTCERVGGITPAALRMLHHEWNIWLAIQRQLDGAFRGRSSISLGELRKRMTPSNEAKILSNPEFSVLEKRQYAVAVQEWRKMMTMEFPVVWSPRGRMVIDRIHDRTPIGFEGMTTVNIMRAATRLFMHGYGAGRTTADPWTAKLSKQALIRFHDDFQDFGRVIGFLDPRTANPASRTYDEASFFTPSGQGSPEALTAQEVFEEVSIMLSAGWAVAKEIHLTLAPHCGVSERDVFGMVLLDETCALAQLRKNFATFFGYIPVLFPVTEYNDDQWKEFASHLMELSRVDGEVPGRIGYGEIRTMSTVLHYIAILQVVYDKNGDGRLSVSEVSAAQPRFHAFIQALITKRDIPWYVRWVKTVRVEDVFPCLVFSQKEPSGGCIFLGVGSTKTVGLPELLKVLAVLKASMPQ